MSYSLNAWAIAAVVPIGLIFGAGSAAAQMTERVSLASDGTESNGDGAPGGVSDDGRFVAFETVASNLVVDDTNNERDVFVRDRLTGRTMRASVNSDGEEGNSASGLGGVWMSGNGRYVLFKSHATNLVDDDTNDQKDIFVHDLETGRTVRVSVSSDGEQADRGCGLPTGSEGISPDGRFVTFNSGSTNLVPDDENDTRDVFVHDRDADANGVFDEECTGCRATIRVNVSSDGTEGDGGSYASSVSTDGRFVSFYGGDSNLVEGDDNDEWDCFVHDRDADEDGIFDEPGAISTEIVTVDSEGRQADSWSARPKLSGDGRYVAFDSEASNLVPDDTNDARDIFVHDRQTRVTVRVSVSSSGNQVEAPPHISLYCTANSMSSSGRHVAFNSTAENLDENIENDVADVFVHDRDTDGNGVFDETGDGCRKTTRVSLGTHGDESDGWSGLSAISSDARFVSFASEATVLVCGDTNDRMDVFVRDRSPRMTGDTNGDGLVDFGDVLDALSQWGPCVDCTADVDGNCLVDFDDVLAILGNWS